jgi:hypothetical protein
MAYGVIVCSDPDTGRLHTVKSLSQGSWAEKKVHKDIRSFNLNLMVLQSELAGRVFSQHI